MQLWDIQHTAFTILSYSLSYVELIGTLFGLLSVYLATRSNILTWPVGIINEICLFLLFYQVALYADMLLQVYFFAITILGWIFWHKTKQMQVMVQLRPRQLVYVSIVVIVGTMLIGKFFSSIHLLFPTYFSTPASFPYLDSCILVLSVFANYFMAKKIIETWVLWGIVNVLSVFLFCYKGIYFLAIEYFLFFILAFYGYQQWKKSLHK